MIAVVAGFSRLGVHHAVAAGFTLAKFVAAIPGLLIPVVACLMVPRRVVGDTVAAVGQDAIIGPTGTWSGIRVEGGPVVTFLAMESVDHVVAAKGKLTIGPAGIRRRV